MANFDPAFVKQILDIAKRQREVNLEHHGQADDLGARLEAAESGAFGHMGTPGRRTAGLKPFSSDNTFLKASKTDLDG